MGALASACRERALISGTDKGGAEAAPWYKAEALGGAKGENSSSSSSGNVSGADTLMGCGGRSSLACRASAGGVYGDDVVDEGVDRITVDVRMVSSRCLSISVRAAASSSASDMGRRRCMCTRSTSCAPCTRRHRRRHAFDPTAPTKHFLRPCILSYPVGAPTASAGRHAHGHAPMTSPCRSWQPPTEEGVVVCHVPTGAHPRGQGPRRAGYDRPWRRDASVI